MKKLCFSTLGCIDCNVVQVLELLKIYNISALEVRGLDGELNNLEIESFKDENLLRTKQAFSNEGIELLSLGTSASCDKLGYDDDAIGKICKEIDVASKLGFKFVRVFGNNITEEYSVVLEKVVYALEKLCVYAAQKNVRVLMEIHGDFNSVETVMPVVERMKKYDSFGILWDVAHTDRVYKENWKEFYEALKPYIYHVHIKDHVREPFGLCDIGKGEIPLKDITDYLEKDGYAGYYSLEWERKWCPSLGKIEDALKDYVDLLR